MLSAVRRLALSACLRHASMTVAQTKLAAVWLYVCICVGGTSATSSGTLEQHAVKNAVRAAVFVCLSYHAPSIFKRHSMAFSVARSGLQLSAVCKHTMLEQRTVA
jgi:hypothetical protein